MSSTVDAPRDTIAQASSALFVQRPDSTRYELAGPGIARPSANGVIASPGPHDVAGRGRSDLVPRRRCQTWEVADESDDGHGDDVAVVGVEDTADVLGGLGHLVQLSRPRGGSPAYRRTTVRVSTSSVEGCKW